MNVVYFDPVDTLFFRDGRPYHRRDLSQAGVVSLFPPRPTTLVGAVRAACARSMGWTGGNWRPHVRSRLGDRADLGPLRFRGPVVVRRSDSGPGASECLFPVPANLIGSPAQNDPPPELALLAPGPEIECDIGSNVRLPTTADAPEGAKLLRESGWWITAAGLQAVLRNRRPAATSLVHRRKLWVLEPRVGIVRGETTRTTDEGAIYSPAHVRLGRGVALAMETEGLPQEFVTACQSLPHPVGGEARACWLRCGTEPLSLPGMPDLGPRNDAIRYTATLLTPADTGQPPRPGEHDYAGLPGRLEAACLPRAELVGGWESHAQGGAPLALRPHLAAGSVLFLEAPWAAAGRIKALHGAAIGNRTAWGYGLTVIGRWDS